MRTIFDARPFSLAPWSPSLGVTVEEAIQEAVEAAPDIYQAYQKGEIAEEERAAREAEAAAARARAEAAQAQAAAAQAAAEAAAGPRILGIPTPYVVVGGLLLAGAAVAIALSN